MENNHCATPRFPTVVKQEYPPTRAGQETEPSGAVPDGVIAGVRVRLDAFLTDTRRLDAEAGGAECGDPGKPGHRSGGLLRITATNHTGKVGHLPEQRERDDRPTRSRRSALCHTGGAGAGASGSWAAAPASQPP